MKKSKRESLNSKKPVKPSREDSSELKKNSKNSKPTTPLLSPSASTTGKSSNESPGSKDERTETPIAEQQAAFDKTVEESKSQLASADEPPKRKRGRPRKTDTPNTVSRAEFSDGDAVTPSGLAGNPPAPNLLVKRGVTFPYSFAAERTGYPGFALSEEESDELAHQVDGVLRDYAPGTVETPFGRLMVCLGTIGMVSGAKYMMYTAWLKEEKRKLTPVPVQTSEVTEHEPAVIPSDRQLQGFG